MNYKKVLENAIIEKAKEIIERNDIMLSSFVWYEEKREFLIEFKKDYKQWIVKGDISKLDDIRIKSIDIKQIENTEKHIDEIQRVNDKYIIWRVSGGTYKELYYFKNPKKAIQFAEKNYNQIDVSAIAVKKEIAEVITIYKDDDIIDDF